VALALVIAASTPAWAGCSCEGMKLFGYMAPNFRMIDSGYDSVKNNMGFGMAYNRVVWTGEIEAGKIVKKVAWRVETDLKEAGSHGLQYAYVQPKFNDTFSVIFGRDKKPFLLESIYSTANQITADRHVGNGPITSLGYTNYGYGLAAKIDHEWFMLTAGVYDGQGSESHVANQDPALDYGARFVLTPPSVEGLEIGVDVMMTTLPEMGKDHGLVYSDTTNAEYLTNSGMAFGFDASFNKDFGKMNLFAQGEFAMGDNWMASPETPEANDTWEDYSWYKWQYMYLKARLKVTPEFGIYAGFSMWDPNTGSDMVGQGTFAYEVGENDDTMSIIPGIIYYWTKNLRTMVEVQMITQKVQDMDAQGNWLDDMKYTHFVLQQVFIWP
jgi:hypothetical protein